MGIPPRRTWGIVAALLIIVVTASGMYFRSRPTGPGGDYRAMALHQTVVAQLMQLDSATADVAAAARQLQGDPASLLLLQDAFARARERYKRTELWIEFYLPIAAEQLNGPPVDDVDLGEGPTAVIPARGFQVMEGLVFPSVDSTRLADVVSEADALHDNASRALLFARESIMHDAQIFDAARLELARIITLGITGFDSPVRHASLAEARQALAGIRDALDPYRTDLKRVAPLVASALDSLFAAADTALVRSTFADFDRLAFIVNVANPLARSIANARESLSIPAPQEARLWRATAPTLFEPGAFDAAALCPGCMKALSPVRAALGERLFFDGAMSGSGMRSCGSCHQPSRAFTDGEVTSAPLTPGTRLRNAPTLINAALQRAQFADMREIFLEDQVAAVVGNPNEMHGAFPATAARIRGDSAYLRSFATAFPGPRDSAITPGTVRAAVAAYVRSLTRLDSRVDLALRGNTGALTSEERDGFNLFAGKAVCATCHFLPLTNGTRPPMYIRSETEVIGVPAEARWTHATVDADPGRAGVTTAPLHRFAFKTPTVRNAALTAPYMHNGVYRTLDDVVRFYNVGGGRGIGINLPNQTLPFDSLSLSTKEQRALIAFLRALTDTSRTIPRR